jgi:oligoendopeptidase F
MTSPVAVAYEKKGWDLSELLPAPDPKILEARLAELEHEAEALKDRRPELSAAMSPAVLLDFLRQYETLMENLQIAESYGHLWFAADTQNAEALRYRNRVDQLVTNLNNRILFFDLWWKGLSDEEATRLLPAEEGTADHRHYLENLRRWRPYALSEPSEQVINIKDANGVQGLVILYSMLTNRLEFRIEDGGETKTLTRDGLMAYAYSTRPELREAAYQELYRVYAREATILGQIYTYRIRDWHNENILLRGFDSPIAVRNLDNDVPHEAVRVLLETTRANRGIFQRYFRLKARWLGVEKLRRYDLYAPLAAAPAEISWQEAVTQVLDTFREFDPHFGALAERVFTEDHIDSEVRPGKRGGAFCSTVSPRFTPWVLVNFTGRTRDVAEVAHELGHAVHSMLAEDHGCLTQHPCLPLAETASVFAEMLVTERILKQEADVEGRRELLAKAVSDVYATVLRQAYFVLFEIEAHQALLEGKSLEDLHELYLANLRDQFGDSVEVSPELRYEWVSIPHLFHTPFYCYAYSFGQLLVLSLYQRFRQEGDAFKPLYLRMLSHGASKPTEEILQEAGIDIADPTFWQGGFEVIRAMVEDLERLPDPPKP